MKFIKNAVKIVGEIIGIYPTNNTTIVRINTGSKDTKFNNKVTVVCFKPTKDIADKLAIGDKVLVKGNLQSSNLDRSNKHYVPYAISASHINKISEEVEDYKTQNFFVAYGSLSHAKKINKNFAAATLLIYTTKANFIRVYFEGKEEDVDEFVAHESKEYLKVVGYFKTDLVRDKSSEEKTYKPSTMPYVESITRIK